MYFELINLIFLLSSWPQIKEGLGGKLRLILSGGAPLAPSVETFLRVVTCAHVLQGYGTMFAGSCCV